MEYIIIVRTVCNYWCIRMCMATITFVSAFTLTFIDNPHCCYCVIEHVRIEHTHIYIRTSELIAADRLAKREILKLEEDLPHWQTVLDTGSGPGK